MLLKGGDNGPAIVLGRSDESELVALVAGLDPENVMPQKGSKLKPEPLRVAAKETFGPYTLLTLERGGLEKGLPGQFFMLEAPGRVLPRALSLCLAPPRELAFLIDPVGPGTRALAALEVDEEIAVFGPLGRGFRLDVRRPLLVGGRGGAPAHREPLSFFVGDSPCVGIESGSR